MRQQFAGGFGGHKHVPLRIAKILMAGVRTANSILMAQLENADRNRGVVDRRKYKPAGSSQRDDSLQRYLYQTFAIDQISRCPVVGLILAKHGAQRYRALCERDPRDRPGGWRDRRIHRKRRDRAHRRHPFAILQMTPIAKGAYTASTSSAYTPTWRWRVTIGQSIW